MVGPRPGGRLAKEDSFGQECVDPFLPIHELGDSQVDRVAGQDVGLLTVEALLLAEKVHHLVDGNPGCHLKEFGRRTDLVTDVSFFASPR